MKLARHTLVQAIAERTEDVRDPKLLAQEIAAYLLEENRVSELESILRDIMQYHTDNGVLEAEVVTAHDITTSVLSDVRSLLEAEYPTAKKVHVASRQDPAVIGGVRVDMANEQLDMTVSAKLATFKRITSGEGI